MVFLSALLQQVRATLRISQRHISGLVSRRTSVGYLIETDPFAGGGQLAKSETQSRRPAQGSMRISTPSFLMK